MSHFSTIKTQFREVTTLRKAIKDLNFSLTEGDDIQILGYAHRTQRVDMAVSFPDGYDIGLSMNEQTGAYDIIADWYGVKTHPQDFLDKLTQRYAYHRVLEEAERQGLTISEDERLKDGSIRLVVRKWE